jgi:hypothetical protein
MLFRSLSGLVSRFVAMQKVVGSSPIIRSPEPRKSGGFVVWQVNARTVWQGSGKV